MFFFFPTLEGASFIGYLRSISNKAFLIFISTDTNLEQTTYFSNIFVMRCNIIFSC